MDLKTFIDSGSANIALIEEMYDKYQSHPESVDPSWREYFEALEKSPLDKTPRRLPPAATAEAPADLRIFNLIQAYRKYGHLLAKVNPIATEPIEEPWQLNIESLGFKPEELSKSFPTTGLLIKSQAPLSEIVATLKAIYCDRIGVEYMGLMNPEMEHWLQEHIEPSRFKIDLTIDQKKLILQDLNKSELLEIFLHTKYVGQKRFSLEGGETLIPMLDAIIEKGAQVGIEDFVIGMAHRGRLNVLSNILNKSYSEIFSEFDEGYIPESFEGSGDVKYHKGFYSQSLTKHGHKVNITLTPNPSHLEAVDPVVEGQVFAKQVLKGDDHIKEKIIPILVHGDAAVAGQGVVYETMQFYKLAGYGTGGTVHIVVNNQIGFTTLPEDGRSTRYATDIARAFGSPVFHVDAEDPEGCYYATILATELRQKFHCDVFIDLNCYRKYGHNETDEPAYTQPHEYKIIRSKKSIREIYRDYLITQGVLEKQVAEELEAQFKRDLQEAQKGLKTPSKQQPGSQKPMGSEREEFSFHNINTGVPAQILLEIATKATTIPEGFTIHPKLGQLMKERLSMVKEGEGAKPIDWGMGEMLAFGSLLWEGIHVRLSGQDSCRGTFSHRHAMWMDQQKELPYYPLKHLKPGQGRFDVFNSPLSEYAVVGFEFGYSLAYQSALVIWEAQFGDFCNGAQSMIDEFISTSEQKWGQKFSLTLFLPHGYEGQGPDHSSARIERFLTLCGDNNMQVVYPSTPAQHFHLLRRQALRSLKKPLVVFTPKGLLRHPDCVSRLEDFTMGSFREILDDPNPAKKVQRLVICTGRIYYDILAERAKLQDDDMAVIRVEQLYPFNTDLMRELINKYRGIKSCAWVQEEPSNMGAAFYMRAILSNILPKDIPLDVVARPRSASPAAGSHALHKKQHSDLIATIFGGRQQTIFDIASHFKK